jgi:hypothetical protein
LLQHAGLATLLSSPALLGFRSLMLEWRIELQPLQDAASISMFKKVTPVCSREVLIISDYCFDVFVFSS